MCGICGEIRWDGQAADVGAVSPDDRRDDVARTGRRRRGGPRTGGARASAAVDHRPVRSRRAADGRQRSRVDAWCSTAASTTTRSCASELQADGYRFFSTADSEVVIKAFHKWGVRCVDRFKGMFAFAIADRDTGRGDAGAGPAGHQAALPGVGARPAAVRIHACVRCSMPAVWTPNWTARRCTTT